MTVPAPCLRYCIFITHFSSAISDAEACAGGLPFKRHWRLGSASVNRQLHHMPHHTTLLGDWRALRCLVPTSAALLCQPWTRESTKRIPLFSPTRHLTASSLNATVVHKGASDEARGSPPNHFQSCPNWERAEHGQQADLSSSHASSPKAKEPACDTVSAVRSASGTVHNAQLAPTRSLLPMTQCSSFPQHPPPRNQVQYPFLPPN